MGLGFKSAAGRDSIRTTEEKNSQISLAERRAIWHPPEHRAMCQSLKPEYPP